jgi:hypothetical protein
MEDRELPRLQLTGDPALEPSCNRLILVGRAVTPDDEIGRQIGKHRSGAGFWGPVGAWRRIDRTTPGATSDQTDVIMAERTLTSSDFNFGKRADAR